MGHLYAAADVDSELMLIPHTVKNASTTMFPDSIVSCLHFLPFTGLNHLCWIPFALPCSSFKPAQNIFPPSLSLKFPVSEYLAVCHYILLQKPRVEITQFAILGVLYIVVTRRKTYEHTTVFFGSLMTLFQIQRLCDAKHMA